ncbi:hypothetical protein C2E21_1826 [Chlorella sorokiniana]|uniref:PDZ domain-containing protein n=1 Tax=Chlorella sorokiniana TaxID=3076 RepID=A0A2P6TZT4_CHLSO|nr:hypothetical protein C2E21_1826 [Chlorella sorokiniana]|eukprot:PRW59574.1 hypothetical protein C2E21_1826 [Chlorella sorokiniana]
MMVLSLPQAQPADPQEARTEEQIKLELPTEDVQANVRLMGVRQGRGAAIVIAAVEPGSAAAAAGLRPGQQLLAVSDPIRRGEFWQINGQSSLRYVRQAIAMRVADTIALQLTAQPIREWQRAIEASRAAQRAAAAALTPAPERPADQPQDDDLLSNIVRASIDSSLSVSSLDSFDASDAAGSASADGDGPALTAAGRAAAAKLTVAEKLEQRYIEGQAAADALAAAESDLERRKRRRKEYFDQQSGRNDVPFFAGVVTLIALPPAVLLIWAISSGYLEEIDRYGLLQW